MNNHFAAFWYRPLWQQYLTIPLILVVGIAASYTFIWQDKRNQWADLQQNSSALHLQNQASSQFFAQNPTRVWLEQELASFPSNEETPLDPHFFVLHLQQLLANNNIVLNQLQPSDPLNSHYQLEIQGKFKDLLEFMQSLTHTLPQQHWQFSDVILTTKNQQLTANLSLTFIKDEQPNEQH
ncbi:hypothetical protein JK188_02685 [Providencia sp. JGM181]|uniref:hypothetical protein n=1 Tax=unclassified Providencia TaxID=2633465 RepID=UPI001BA5B1E3|nr:MULTISPECIES: hypothetical protein [unclassified Providencia]MBS0923385.1 hypothetical protein [Providencia sp. JGM181]MBS0935209.1 hypothetical protein [Providencia sp. JGM172]MBS0999310.1 hypothetical protein [Providencia sp. JGM178]